MAINRDKVYEGAMKLLAAGKFDKGIVELQKLTAEDPKDVRTLLKIAETLHVKMGKRKEALETYDKAASLYSEQGFFLKGVAVFKQMLSVDATNPDLHLRLAELYQQMGYGSQCIHHYQQVVVLFEQQGRIRDTLAILKRMVDLDPENLQSRVKLAELYFHEGMGQEAVVEMRQAFAFLNSQERYDDALRVGEKVFAWEPTAVDMARELGIIYMKRGEAKNALTKLQLCFKQAPRDLEVLWLIASAFLALDQHQKTVSVYKEMARIHDSDGNQADGRGMWERVLELAPGDDEAEGALGRRQVVAPAAPAVPRMSAEDEQLQRLLTETDVYVKYGLRDKAIEHLNKIFDMRPDHLPAMEKLRQLQNKTNQKAAAVETLRRMVQKGGEISHPKLAEWSAELARVAVSVPTAPAPRQPPQGEQAAAAGEDPAADVATTLQTRRAANMLASVPSMMATPSRRPVPPRDEPLDEPFDEPFDEPLAPSKAVTPPTSNTRHAQSHAHRPPPAPLAANEEEFDAPTGNLPLNVAPALPNAPFPKPVPVAIVDDGDDDDDDDDQAKADQVVRASLQSGSTSFTGHGSDENLAKTPAAVVGPPDVPTSAPAFLDDDAAMLDDLAAQAVQEAMPTRPQEAAPSLGLSHDELGELESFARIASQEGAPPVDADDDFGGRTVVYGGPDWQQQLSVMKGSARLTVDDSLLETGEHRAAAVRSDDNSGVRHTAMNTELTGDAALPAADFPHPGEVHADEFNPDEFDLPDDVKASLNAVPPRSGGIVGTGLVGNGFDVQHESTGAFALGDIPSLASMDAEAVLELDVRQSAPASTNDAGDDAGDVSRSRALFAPEQGFEDDPANTFFADELAEAEFLIQQDLLDEAREILEPILDEIDDSQRVKHMLARISAREAGEPEPRPPWQQRLMDDVAAEAAPVRDLSDPGQVSVGEVLSQFKKGIAETVADDDSSTHYDLGIAYREMGLLDDAVGEFETASKSPAKAADSWFLIGLVRMEQGRPDDALNALDRAVSAPTASQSQQAAAEYQRGVVLFDQQKGPLALAAFKRSKSMGGSASDLDRRIQSLIKDCA